MGKTHSNSHAHHPDVAITKSVARKTLATLLWQAAIDECCGEHATNKALSILPKNERYAILSIGKAASSMTLGAQEVLGNTVPSLSITKDEHTDDRLKSLAETHPHIKYFESAHPVPDGRSLLAGRSARDFIERLPEDTCLIMLVSGGASALCELLPAGMGLDDLQKLTERKLATGATITEINKARSEVSLIKRGKILERFKGKSVKAYIISDVAGDDIETIGSGISMYPHSLEKGKFKHTSEILRSNKDARFAAEKLAKQAGLKIRDNSEKLYGDVFDCATLIARDLTQGEEGVYIYGGEPTVELPDNPGEGGRSQCLALALSKKIKDIDNLSCLIAGSDGTDGPTDAAGGIVDCHTFSPEQDATEALELANSGAFLRSVDALFVSGPTGTNVMDIGVCLKISDQEARRALETIDQ